MIDSPIQTFQTDMVFIRHAESDFNFKTLEFVQKKNIVYDWNHLSSMREYLEEVKYHYSNFDAPITQKGQGQCQIAKENLVNYKPDLIIVSPLNRALTTCSIIFPNAECPIIVQPLLSEGLRSSCDYSYLLQTKKPRFPTYNFDKVQKDGNFWYLKNESEKNYKEYMEIVNKNDGKAYEEIVKQLLKHMLETQIYQTATNLRQRTTKVKQLLKEYRKTYSQIAVVCHFNIIRFSLAKEFNERDEPFHNLIQNCEIIPLRIQNL